MKTYEGFKDWNDLCKQYEITEPEPEEVYFAVYDTGCYEGSSFIAFRNCDTFYLEESSHCSCYGLEHSWSPEPYQSKALFIECLKKRAPTESNLKEKILELIVKLENEPS